MPVTGENTTLICLFHHRDHADATVNDLHQAGIAPSSITTLGGEHNENRDTHLSMLEQLGVPERDLKHLHEGLHDGGSIVAVRTGADDVESVQRIFAENKAEKIDEAETTTGTSVDPLAGVGTMAIPIVEEELQVGKRTVDQGGVRVFRRVVEMPAEASVNLREEHVVIERRPVDRVATAAELNSTGRIIELTETVEEAVVGKTAHVVEEVIVGKQVSEHTEHITDTVRKTEVDVDAIAATNSPVLDRNKI